MRILGVAPYYSPEGGGLERYAHAIFSRLAERGHDVEVLAFTERRPASTLQDGVLVQRGRPLLRIGKAPVHPGFATRVERVIRSRRPDVVVAHTPVPFPAEMAQRAARRAGVPFVATYHAGRLRGSTAPLDALARLDRALLERRMLAGSARLIAVSPYVRDHALARHKARVTVVTPGVDSNRFAPDGPPAGAGILFVGPLATAYEWKGLDVLWSAFGRVRAQVPTATLTLVGDGDRRAEFVAHARRAAGALRVLGRVAEPDLVEAYRRAAVVVLPSTSDAEAFGMVLAEANACARPVVASAIGGIPDFVREGFNGLLAAPGNPDDLAAKLRTVLEDAALARRLGARGRNLVVHSYGWDERAAATERVLGQASETSSHVVPADAGRGAPRASSLKGGLAEGAEEPEGIVPHTAESA